MTLDQDHTGAGDNVGNNKIGTQINADAIHQVFWYGDKKIPKHLTSTPFRPDGFMGRETEFYFMASLCLKKT